MKITCTKPNAINKLKGSRVTIKDDNKVIIDQFEVPAYKAVKYCQDHPTGKHGKRFAAAVEKAEESDFQIKKVEYGNNPTKI